MTNGLAMLLIFFQAVDGAGHYSTRECLLQRDWLISLTELLSLGFDPLLAVIDFDCSSSSTRLTASKRS